MNLYSNGLSNFFVENATADKLLENRKYFTSAIKDFKFKDAEEIDKFIDVVTSATSEELSKYLTIFKDNLNCKTNKDVFYGAQMLYAIITKCDTTDDQANSIAEVMNALDQAHKETDDEWGKASNDILRKVGHKVDILKEEAICGIGFNNDDVYYRTASDIEKYKSIFESIVFDNPITDFTGLMHKKETVDISDLLDYLRDFSYTNTDFDKKPDNEFLIARINKFPAYVCEILSAKNVTEDAVDGIFWLLTQTLSAVRRNEKGLDDLYTAISLIEDDLDTISVASFAGFNGIQYMKDFIDHMKASIMTDRNNIIVERVRPDVNPLSEMGFGYFFENMPLNENFTEETFKNLNEAAIRNNALNILQETVHILNEAKDPADMNALEYSIHSAREERKDRIDMHKEDRETRERMKLEHQRQSIEDKRNQHDADILKKKQDKENAIADKKQKRIDDRDARKQARVDARAAKKQERIDDRNARKQMKIDYKKAVKDDKLNAERDRLNHKRQAKQERIDARYEQRQENNAKAKENFRNSVSAGAAYSVEYIRSLSGTSEGAAKAKKALHAAVSAALVGGVSGLVGIAPVIGASLSIMNSYGKSLNRNDQTSKSYTRGAMVSDIEKEIQRLDGKIREYENQGNQKAVTKLETLKKQLEDSREAIYNSAAYEGGVVRR